MYIWWWIMLGGCVGRNVTNSAPQIQTLMQNNIKLDVPGVSVEWKPTTAHKHPWGLDQHEQIRIERGLELSEPCYYAATVGIKLQEVGGTGRKFAACRKARDTTAGRKLLWCRKRVHPTHAQSAVCALALCMHVHGVEQVMLTQFNTV